MLRAASTAVQVTVVGRTAKVDPDAGTQITAGCAGATSVAVAANVATAPPGPLASSVCDGGWTTTEGGVTSVTTTWKLPVARFCFQSRAEHETVVVAIGTCDPDDGLHVSAAGPETASTADAV